MINDGGTWKFKNKKEDHSIPWDKIFCEAPSNCPQLGSWAHRCEQVGKGVFRIQLALASRTPLIGTHLKALTSITILILNAWPHLIMIMRAISRFITDSHLLLESIGK